MLLMDMQFELLQDDAHEMGIELNTASANKHVPEIERMHHVIEERVWSIYNTLPYNVLPTHMIIEMVNF